MFPEKTKKAVLILCVILCMGAGAYADLSNPYAPESTQEAVTAIADRLVEKQLVTGDGSWPVLNGVPQGWFTGTMAAGLADAYWMTCISSYKTKAELAGTWILDHTDGCSMFYDDAYALMKLSEINCTPGDNIWRTALVDFYNCVELQPYDETYDKAGTALVIADLEVEVGYPWVVFEVAHYTVAAYYIDTPEKEVWRTELIRLLEGVNEPYGAQVMMLGVATWALAQTGDLDATPCEVGSPLSTPGMALQLSELPGLLAAYQVSATSPYEDYRDHFITIYNYPVGNVTYSGYTETNMYAAMGLAAADKYAGYDFRSELDRLWAVNMQPVDQNADVWWDAIEIPGTTDNEEHYHYAGEYLQYLAATRLPGDTNSLDSVDFDDLVYFADQWLKPLGCTSCNRADLNRDRKVNLADFAELAQGWMLSR